MRRMRILRGVILAAASFANIPLLASIELASPIGGEKVTLLSKAQRDVISLPTFSKRVERLKEKWTGKKGSENQWGKSCPLVLRWRATDGEQGPWKILIGKKADLSDARAWLVSEGKPRLCGETEKKVFGVKLTDANLEVGETYHWCVWSNVKCTKMVSCGSTMRTACPKGEGHGRMSCASKTMSFKTDGQAPRWIALEGRVKNVRDLGGWRTRDGRRVKQGMAFRGQGLNDDSVDGETPGKNRLTVEDVAYLKQTLGIRTDLDLRTPSEIAGMTKSPLGDGVKFIHHPSPCYSGIFKKDGKGSSLADKGMRTMAENFRVFCDERNYPIYFHCIGGADRTGSLAYVLNAVLGVDRYDLELDWESTFYPDGLPEVKSGYSGKREWRSIGWLDDGFARFGDVDSSWNDRVVQYLMACGVTRTEIEKFREIMLEPKEEQKCPVVHSGQELQVVRDIAYDPSIGRFGLGDLYLPEKVTPETPVVLAIHGGGWGGGDRYSWSGVAEFFCRDLGCAVFNIEYRLASAANRWPACGDDCVKAANWLFSDGFRERAGVSPKKIYICGGSAGGHLTLWTLVNLPPERVAGGISISAVGDPSIDFQVHGGRYGKLFGANVDEGALTAMNPILKIKSGTTPVLCTHATEDKVVPIASHKAFAEAYRAAGNTCVFFEYPSAIREGLTEHCIWIPDSKPHRLIPEIEARIAKFLMHSGN